MQDNMGIIIRWSILKNKVHLYKANVFINILKITQKTRAKNVYFYTTWIYIMTIS